MKAKHLRIEIIKNNIKTVSLSFPAKAIQWILELIPDEYILKIQAANIDLEKIQEKYKNQEIMPGEIFNLKSIEKDIRVWLE